MITATNDDYALLDQPSIVVHIKVEVKNDDGTMFDNLEGLVQGGSVRIDANSSVRRTTNFTIVPLLNNITISNGLNNTTFDLSEKSIIWINKKAVLKIGIENIRNKQVPVWYTLGTFIFQKESITYDATTNQMQVSCSDMMTLLDGTVNGERGQLTTKIPAYKEDEDTGEVLEYYYIRPSMIQVLTQLGGITDYWVDDIGEFKGMKQYNPDWQNYRTTHPLWDNIPYDLEFDAGCTVLDIITELRDLYPNYETFFDETGRFICQMIPSCYYDEIAIPDNIIQKYLISEDTERDLTSVRNVCEVWGQVLDTDFYSEEVTNSNNVYTATIDGLDEKYMNGDKVALQIPSTNAATQYININSLGNVQIYDENTEEPLAAGTLEASKIYVFECKKLRTSSGTDDEMKFYLLGEFQVHALSVLTDGSVVKDGWTDPDTGTTYDLYSKEYFQTKYNVRYVDMNVIADSPFTVQKIGERNSVKKGDEYDDITSDTLALARAHYENWKNCRLTDNITITTILIPWLDVNTKVSYCMKNDTEIKQYIVKSVTQNLDSMTSQITMMTFYPLYEESITG